MPSTGPKNITNAMLKAALRKHGGVFVLAAQELGCDRTNVSQRVRRSPELQAVCAQIEEEFGDLAEGVIKVTLNDRDAVTKKPTKAAQSMARWYAPMKLRDRGYATRTELTGKDGAPLAPAGPPVKIVVQYVEPKPVGVKAGEDVI